MKIKNLSAKKIAAIFLIVAGLFIIVMAQINALQDEKTSKNIESSFAIENETEGRTESSDNDANNIQPPSYRGTNNTALTLDWDKLLSINSDVIAWIKIPGTGISQPVLKGQSNETYLRHNIYGKYTRNGSVFVAQNNENPFEDLNTIIYGHNLGGGKMFSNLKKYKNLNFWKNNKYVYIFFPDGTVKTYEIISFHTEDDADEHIYGTYYTKFSEFMPYIEEDNIYSGKTSYNFNNVDRVITLSTCTNRSSNERYVIHAISYKGN